MYLHIFLVYCFVSPFIPIQAQWVRVTYGEKCGGTRRCDFRAYLACNNGKCECIIPEAMIFQGKTCALLAGENCNLSEAETMSCAPNSTCLDGLCVCNSGFFQTLNGTCTEKLDYGSSCHSDDQCNKERFLICKQNQCDCSSSIATNKSNTSGKIQCALISGVSCDNKLDHCVPHAECINNVCQCKNNYFANSKGECERKRPFNESCTNDSECDEDAGGFPFSCDSGGRCGCNSTRPIFSNQVCARPAGSECNIVYYNDNCIFNSYCDPIEGKCTCFSHSFQTTLGTCKRKKWHREGCNSSEECLNSHHFICGSSGICECETPLVFDSWKKQCVNTLGSKCEDTRDNFSIKCITNTECMTYIFGRNRVHLCECSGPNIRKVNGSCLVSYGGKCGLDNISRCNEIQQGTICIEGICSCKSGVFDEIKRVCVSSVYGLCNDTNDCITNSHCVELEGESSLKQCACNNGFVPVDNECRLTIGQPCKYTEIDENQPNIPFKGHCDPIASLTCINGTCQCGAEEEYDVEKRKCRGLVGSPCYPEDTNFCTSDAECKLRWSYSMKKGKCTCKPGRLPDESRKCVGITTTTSAVHIDASPKPTEASISDM